MLMHYFNGRTLRWRFTQSERKTLLVVFGYLRSPLGRYSQIYCTCAHINPVLSTSILTHLRLQPMTACLNRIKYTERDNFTHCLIESMAWLSPDVSGLSGYGRRRGEQFALAAQTIDKDGVGRSPGLQSARGERRRLRCQLWGSSSILWRFDAARVNPINLIYDHVGSMARRPH